MASEGDTNTYEEARKKRLLDNKKRFEDLGLLKISKDLSDLSKSEKKSQQHSVRHHKPRNLYEVEPRRSSRARNPISSYRDELDIDLPSTRAIRRSKSNSSWASYLARPIDEVKTATYEERVYALVCAEKLQSNLLSKHPSFVKSMVRSHVYSCFWLGLPSKFCEDYLPKSTVDIVLENEDGTKYEAVFIGKRVGLSGGWRAFALDHKLDDGDALVFELIEPTKFKVYIVRASNCSCPEDDEAAIANEVDNAAETTETDNEPKKSTKSKKGVKGKRKRG